MGTAATVQSGNMIRKEQAKEQSGEQWDEDAWNEETAGKDYMSLEKWNKIVESKTSKERKKTVKDYRRLKHVGKGAYGHVDLVVRRKDGELFVMKIVKEDTIVTKNNHVQSAMNEARILQSLQHPNIVGLADFFPEGKYLVLILEYCDSRDLKYRINTAAKKNRQFREQQVMDWFVQLCFALDYLHERKLAHRDIKPQNVFLARRNKILKLGDLGVTRKLDNTLESMKTVVGTPYYMAPELAQGKGYNLSNDTWALGCCLAETMLLAVPFPAKDFMELVGKITEKSHTPISTVYSESIRKIVDWMLTKDPNKRPTIAEVLANDFVQNHIKGFAKRYKVTPPATAEAIKAQEEDKQKEAQKQESLKQHIVKADTELDNLKQQISKETDAAKKGALEKQYLAKRNEIHQKNIELHSSVHIADEDAMMDKVLAFADGSKDS